MDSLQRGSVTLLINGDDLTPSQITALLGAEPTLGAKKGEQFTNSSGKQQQAKIGMWHFGEGWKSPSNINQEVAAILGQLTEDVSVWKQVTDRFTAYVSVGGDFDGWTGGMTLRPEIMRMLAARSLAIDFDLYAPAASD